MNKRTILILGDILAFVILTIIGFATHNTANLSFLSRMAVVFFPVIFSWFVLAPWLGLFDETLINSPKELWRVVFAFLFVGPLAVILRGAWLNAPALPLFALILGASDALGMLVWRGLYIFIARRMK